MSKITSRLIELRPDQLELWDRALPSSPQATLFHSSLWGKILAQSGEGRLRIFVPENENVSGAGLVFTEKMRGPFCMACNSLLTPYTGFLLPAPSSSKLSDRLRPERQLVRAGLEWLERNASHSELFLSPEFTDLRAAQWRGWAVRPVYTYILPLASPDDLWNSFDSGLRQQIRKGERQGFEVTHEATADEVTELVRGTYERRGKSCPLTPRFIKTLIADAALEQHRRLWLARSRDGKCLSFLMLVGDHRRAYYLLSATDDEALSSSVHPALLWAAIQSLVGKFDSLDLVGANSLGIAKFKEGLNPKLATYFRIEHWSSRTFRFLKRATRSILRRRSSVE
ncbi:MAG: GNAT family N-acetyltransferase [bacterium]